MGQSILSYRLNAVLKISNVRTILTYGRKGSGLIFPHFVTEKSVMRNRCTMCGDTNKLRDVDASFGESCLFLLSGDSLLT